MSYLSKVFFKDILKDKKRALLSFFAISIGCICFSITLFSNNIISREITNEYNSINPSSATIYLDNIDDNLIRLTSEFDEIESFEEKAFYEFNTTINDKLTTVQLFSFNDYTNININKIFSLDGSFNPQINKALIERDSASVANKSIGENITISIPNGKNYSFDIEGVVYDINRHPAKIHQWVYLYISKNTLKEMELKNNQIDIIISSDKYNKEKIINTTNEYIKVLESNGYKILGLEIPKTPGISMHEEEYTSSLFLLQIFSVVGFLFGCLIMGNLLSSVLKAQIKQMGILKSIGISKNKILLPYLTVFFLIIISISIFSLAISIIISGRISIFLLAIANLYPHNTTIPINLIFISLILSIIIPSLLGFIIINSGLKVTIKDAINNYGINFQNNTKINFRFLNRPTMMSIRNSFRVKKRFVLNVGLLTFGGLLFIIVLTAMFSVNNTLSNNIDTNKYNYHFVTRESDKKIIENEIKNIEYIKEYEIWFRGTTQLLSNDGNIESSFNLISPAENTNMMVPDIIDGDWLEKRENEVVLSHEAAYEHNYKIGDSMILKSNDIVKSFIISGIIKDFSGSNLYINNNDFITLVNQENSLSDIKINSQTTGKRKNEFKEVEDKIKNTELTILMSESKTDMFETFKSHYSITLQTFLIIIIMIVLVAGFGLSATMNTQATEKIKEIGIMKSFGTNRKQIKKLISIESIFISIVSFIFSAILGIPLSFAGIIYFEKYIMQMPIDFDTISLLIATIIWFLLALVVGYHSSVKVAKTTSKLTIKDTLSFE